jgi:hypothetical protein
MFPSAAVTFLKVVSVLGDMFQAVETAAIRTDKRSFSPCQTIKSLLY